MPLKSWGIAEALNVAIAGLTLLETDARLDSAEQALVGELIQVDQLALAALRPDGTIPGGQRNARAQAIEDKVFALSRVEAAHETNISITEFYDMLDLSEDCAGAIRLGAPTFLSSVGG